ncbi:MAG: rhodanese-like domain-containing protein [Rhizobiaceae bacterium]
MKKGYKALLAEANAEIEAVSPEQVAALARRDDVQLVDLRDIRELQREGKMPGAFHAPRGMLEFWIDPESPYHRDIFSSGKTFIFYCASGWRSALATKAAQDMGLAPVKHVEGGFSAWKKARLPVEQVEKKS